MLAELGRVVARSNAGTREAVLGVRGELLERALAATARLVEGSAPVLPAWRRYSGVVWGGLEPATLRPGKSDPIMIGFSAAEYVTNGRRYQESLTRID